MNARPQPGGVMVIAEAGVNHNGSLDLARQLVDAAAKAGADAIKFQTFRPELVASRHAQKAAYQVSTTKAGGTQLDMIRELALDDKEHEILVRHADGSNIRFMSTPFDIPSLHLLVERLGVGTIKVSSGDITNAPLLLEMARTGKAIILSTGMSTLADIEDALGVLSFGYDAGNEKPRRDAMRAAFASENGQARLKRNVTLLHCTTEYPSPYDAVNLRAMGTLSAAFGLRVGLSDHTMGSHVAIAAVARGACIIEKHITLDRGMKGPDHAASLMPDEFAAMIRSIRDVESALGDGIKRPAAVEWKNRSIARRSLVASQPIRSGEIFTVENVTCKRPGNGRSPFDYWDIIGTTAARDYAKDATI
jgi:N-acetylneuraminate synthase